MAETFGEADIVLRMRLDELDRDIRTAEIAVSQSIQRVEASQIAVHNNVNRAAADTTAKDSALATYGAWALLAKGVSLVRVGIMAIPAVAAAASVAMTGAAVAAGVGLLAVNALVVEGGRKVKDFSRELVDSYRAMDGSKERARAFAGELDRIPLIGEPVSTMFNLFSKDAQQSELALASLVSVVEDGEVKTRAWATIGSAAIYALTGGFVDLRKDILAANEAMVEQRELMAFRAEGGAFDRSMFSGLDQLEQRVERAHLADLRGVDAVREAERQRHEDAMRELDLRARAAAENFSARRDRLRDESGFVEGEEFNPGQLYYDKLAMLTQDRDRQLAGVVATRVQVGEKLNAQLEARVAAAEAEAQAAQDAEQAEARRAARRRGDAMLGLAVSVSAAELRAAGEDFEAQRVEIEHEAQMAITRAMEDGDSERASLERRYADARLSEVRTSAQRRFDAEQRVEDQRFIAAEAARSREADAQRRAADAKYDAFISESLTNDALFSQVRQLELRAAGEDKEAERERIEAAAYQQIQRFLEAGNEDGAALARRARDLRLAEVDMRGMSAAARHAQFRQTSASRFSAGVGEGGGEREEREQKEQTKVLKSIDRAVKEKTVAVAG